MRENYAPDIQARGRPARSDFVGWSGRGPIRYLLEYGIGLTAHAQHNELVWHLDSKERTGCERFRFNGHAVTLIAELSCGRDRRILIEPDGPCRLRILTGGG